MPTSPEEKVQPARYVLDAENVAEMGRLTRQAELTTRYLGLLPQGITIPQNAKILDIACGPGEWSLAMAKEYPSCQVTGIDISQLMTAYAQDTAQNRQLYNVTFQVMNAHKRLELDDASFDLVHLRFANSFLSTTLWPRILAECWRITRPGGHFISIESEGLGVTTSPSLARYNQLMIEVMRQLGQCFTTQPDFIGITVVQAKLLAEAGFDVLGDQTYSSYYSAGTDPHQAMYDDCVTLFKLLQPLILNFRLTTREELDVLYERTKEEMMTPDFCGKGYCHRVFSRRPA